MANQPPSTPVKVPGAAASYTPAMLDPDLRSQINAVLIRDGHVTAIQDQLLHSLHSNQANWPTLIQTHALNLLRSGEVHTFPALVRRVMDDIRQDTANKSSSTNGTSEVNGSAKKANGTSTENGGDSSKKDGGATGQIQRRGTATNEAPSLALPPAVVEDALRVTREALETATVDAGLGKRVARDVAAPVGEANDESSGEWSALLKAEETEGEELQESDVECQVVWVTDEASETDVSESSEEENGGAIAEEAGEDVDGEEAAIEEGEEEDDDSDDDADDEQESSDEYQPGGEGSDDDD